MASTPHPPPKPEPPKSPPPKPAVHSSDPQEAKLELAAANAPVKTELPPGVYETVADEQRARSAEMEKAGGPEAYMKAHASPPDGAKVVEGVAAHKSEKP